MRQTSELDCRDARDIGTVVYSDGSEAMIKLCPACGPQFIELTRNRTSALWVGVTNG